MKKTIIVATILLSLLPQTVFAATTSTLLPSGAEQMDDTDCAKYVDKINTYSEEARKEQMANESSREIILSCGIKSGNIHLWMIPFFITRLIEFLINIAGLISVLFVILGGYFYAWGGLTEDKEKGKKTIMYALIGLVLATMAWIIVNIVQTTLSS